MAGCSVELKQNDGSSDSCRRAFSLSGLENPEMESLGNHKAYFCSSGLDATAIAFLCPVVDYRSTRSNKHSRTIAPLLKQGASYAGKSVKFLNFMQIILGISRRIFESDCMVTALPINGLTSR